jgi:hypothetical protein
MWACLLWIALIGSALFGAPAAAAPASVRGISVQTLAAFTRVTVELSGPAKPLVAPFPAEPDSGRPERLALDFPGAELEIGGASRIEVHDGRIDAIRFGRTKDGGVRIVLDLVRAARHRALRHISPPRIELDVLGAGENEPAR